MLERKLVICTCIVELVCYGYLVACYCLYRNRLALVLVSYLKFLVVKHNVAGGTIGDLFRIVLGFFGGFC